MAPLLEMRDIRKSFLGVEVLHGVGLDCEAGEIHAVVGENGAGKSTLMKVLAGVHAPDGGEVKIDGEVEHFHHPVQAQAAGVAIIFQEFNLLPTARSRRTCSSTASPRAVGSSTSARWSAGRRSCSRRSAR
jgi:ribose transport system ATP-binding protein